MLSGKILDYKMLKFLTSKQKLMAHKENHDLLAALNDCIAACHHCAYACLDEPDVKMMVACIKTDLDCAEVCSLIARLTARGTVHAKDFFDDCIRICEACAEECDKHAQHMEHCRECAEACRKCAAACRTAARL